MAISDIKATEMHHERRKRPGVSDDAQEARRAGLSLLGGQPSCDQRLQLDREQCRADSHARRRRPPTLPSSSNPARAIVETALDASQVARKLIDWARRATAVEGDQAGPESPAVDLNQLIRDKLESEKSMASDQVDWVLNLGSIPPIPGDAGALADDAGLSAAKRSRGVARAVRERSRSPPPSTLETGWSSRSETRDAE